MIAVHNIRHARRDAMKTLVLALGSLLVLAGTLGLADEPIDFNKARELMRKERSGEKLTDAEAGYLAKAKAARRAPARPDRAGGPNRAGGGKDKIGQKPLTEMTADDRYQDQDGGLYGGGHNEPPAEHRQRAEAALAAVQPLDAAGQPSDNGTIGFISISMSNATQEFSVFKRLADADRAKSPRVTIVDCAQGGQAMAEWVDPDAGPWQVAARRLAAAKLSPEQVQIAWIKLANKSPRGSLEEHGRKLEQDTLAVIHNAKAKFPNLKVAYLSSRIYGGYATSALNPEPFAFESAFPVRWLIQRQIKGDEALNTDAAQGDVRAPVLLWGPYLWADGVTPRQADGLIYERSDLGSDGTHPSVSGREMVARLMLTFYKSDPLAKTWFAK
jgi:hypothetical protein